MLEGRPLLEHVLTSAAACLGAGTLAGVTVVLPGGPATPAAYGTALASLAARSGAGIVVNDDPPAGLSRSLRLGLAAADAAGSAAAVVFLADQPRVRPEAVAAVVGAWRSGAGPVVVPRYGGAPGNPVLLDRSVWFLAAELSGDAGIAAVVRSRAGIAAYVELAGANPDVDTPADLAALARG